MLVANNTNSCCQRKSDIRSVASPEQSQFLFLQAIRKSLKSVRTKSFLQARESATLSRLIVKNWVGFCTKLRITASASWPWHWSIVSTVASIFRPNLLFWREIWYSNSRCWFLYFKEMIFVVVSWQHRLGNPEKAQEVAAYRCDHENAWNISALLQLNN